MSAPYFEADGITLHHGDCRDLLPRLGVRPDAVVTDPPYGETSAAWDVWPDGWVKAVGAVLPDAASLWMFGSTRMMLTHAADLAGWRYAQESLWVKRNGTGPTSRDRLVKVHEWAYHWYRGRWSDLYHEWEREPSSGPTRQSAVRKSPSAVAHQGARRANEWRDDGTRQPRSVTFVVEAPSVRYAKRHQDEKPLACVIPLVRECVPPGGLVLDPFAGSGTTGIAARMLGRRALLIEADERSCEVIATRLQDELAIGVTR